jgi:hypothetical protein
MCSLANIILIGFGEYAAYLFMDDFIMISADGSKTRGNEIATEQGSEKADHHLPGVAGLHHDQCRSLGRRDTEMGLACPAN